MVNLSVNEADLDGITLLNLDYSPMIEKLETHEKPYKKLVIHHSGSRDCNLNELINMHMHQNGWGAIGYHFVIDSIGDIYYTRDLRFKGSHAYPNTGKIGVGFLRSFDKKEPNKAERNALELLKIFLKEKYGVEEVLGHNQDQLTELEINFPRIKQFELYPKLWKPASVEEFESAKNKLLGYESSREFDKLILGLKTCPGVQFYRGE